MRIAIASAFRHGAARRAPLLQHAALGVAQQRSMHLTPRELDHLRLAQAGQVAQRRLARGQRLNHPEAVAPCRLPRPRGVSRMPGMLKEHLPVAHGRDVAIADRRERRDAPVQRMHVLRHYPI